MVLREPYGEVRPVVDDALWDARSFGETDHQQLIREMTPLTFREGFRMDLVVEIPHPAHGRGPATGGGRRDDRPSHYRERGRLAVGGAHQLVDRAGFGSGVRIQQDEGVARGSAKDLPQRTGLAATVRFDDDPDPGIFLRKPLCDPHSSIGAAARNDPDLAPRHPLGKFLFEKGAHGRPQVVFLIVSDHPPGQNSQAGRVGILHNGPRANHVSTPEWKAPIDP